MTVVGMLDGVKVAGFVGGVTGSQARRKRTTFSTIHTLVKTDNLTTSGFHSTFIHEA
ncbi:hypothetical protein SAMN04488518_101213 [Pseudovibrio ascidiaceicola]|uniref:Uncharacterized protein n=1 Tax=Pseudovibrio ascidiaceicola TaxID=285279 RepID=A0A1I3V6N3_9HYPH|nr:hypothetical protein [Pseudovibrio ascidiaceicola]SFJ90679.1 hypothetical protein SAMN04488518_101213 [Pseudovibrio ascidiaceicola]